MSRGSAPTKKDEGRVEADEGGAEGASDFDWTFTYALIIYAVLESVAVALVVYHKLSR